MSGDGSADVRCEEHAGAPWSAAVEACDECQALSVEAAHDRLEAAEAAEVASGAVEWAEAAAIRVDHLPDDLRRRAERHYATHGHERVPGSSGLEAFVRHHCTNYDALLRALQAQFPAVARGGLAYSALRHRVDEAVHDALDDWQTRCVD